METDNKRTRDFFYHLLLHLGQQENLRVLERILRRYEDIAARYTRLGDKVHARLEETATRMATLEDRGELARQSRYYDLLQENARKIEGRIEDIKSRAATMTDAQSFIRAQGYDETEEKRQLQTLAEKYEIDVTQAEAALERDEKKITADLESQAGMDKKIETDNDASFLAKAFGSACEKPQAPIAAAPGMVPPPEGQPPRTAGP